MSYKVPWYYWLNPKWVFITRPAEQRFLKSQQYLLAAVNYEIPTLDNSDDLKIFYSAFLTIIHQLTCIEQAKKQSLPPACSTRFRECWQSWLTEEQKCVVIDQAILITQIFVKCGMPNQYLDPDVSLKLYSLIKEQVQKTPQELYDTAEEYNDLKQHCQERLIALQQPTIRQLQSMAKGQLGTVKAFNSCYQQLTQYQNDLQAFIVAVVPTMVKRLKTVLRENLFEHKRLSNNHPNGATRHHLMEPLVTT